MCIVFHSVPGWPKDSLNADWVKEGACFESTNHVKENFEMPRADCPRLTWLGFSVVMDVGGVSDVP